MENDGSQGAGWRTLGSGKGDLTVGVLYLRWGSSLVHTIAPHWKKQQWQRARNKQW